MCHNISQNSCHYNNSNNNVKAFGHSYTEHSNNCNNNDSNNNNNGDKYSILLKLQ